MKLENRGEHLLALEEVTHMMGGRPDAWLRVLAQAVEDYETEHFPVGAPARYLCSACDTTDYPVLNKAGDDIACAKCGAALVGEGVTT